MPFLQYVSSTGHFHFHTTDAPTRTIHVDAATLSRDRERSGQARSLQQPSRYRRPPPEVRAIVLNTQAAENTTPNMPPELIDLTGDDNDGDEHAAQSIRSRFKRHASANPARTSGTAYVKHEPTSSFKRSSSKDGNGAREVIELSPGPHYPQMTSKGSTNNPKHVTNPGLKTQTGSASQSSQNSQLRKPGDMNQKRSADPSLTGSSSQKERPKAMTGEHGKNMSRPPFQMPHGPKQTPSNSSIGSVFNKKRPADNERLNGSSFAPKKQKLDSGVGDRRSTPASDGSLRESLVKRAESGNESRHRSSPLKSNANRLSGTDRVTSFSPPPIRQETRTQDRSNRNAEPLRGNGNSTQPLRDRLPDSDATEMDSPPQPRQKLSLNSSPSTLNSRPTTTNKPRDGGEMAKGSTSPSEQPPRRDTTPRIRKETEKAQALSAGKKQSRSGSDSQTSSGKPKVSDPQKSVNSRPNGIAPGNGTVGTPTDKQESNSPVGIAKVAGNVDLPQDSSRKSRLEGVARIVKPARSSPASADSLQDSPHKSRPEDAARLVKPARPSPASSAQSRPGELDAQNKAKAGEQARAQSHATSKSLTSRPRVQSDRGDDEGRGIPGDTHTPSEPSKPRASPSRSHLSGNLTQGLSDKSQNGRISSSNAPTPQSKPAKATVRKPASSDVQMRETSAPSDAADLQLRSEAMNNVEHSTAAARTDNSFASRSSATPTMKPPATYSSALPLGSRVEKVLGKYLEELRDDNEYWTSNLMSRARISKDGNDTGNASNSKKPQDERPTSFRNLKPSGLAPYQKGNPSIKSDQIWGIEKMSSSGRAPGHMLMSGTYATFESYAEDVPNYAHYVPIRNNILAPNVTNLICWPYFGDEFDLGDATNLGEQYHLDMEDRERKLLVLLQAQKYEEYVESALEDLGITWADVLRFLLEPHPELGSSMDAEKALRNRSEFCEHDFSRSSERWRSVLEGLPSSTSEKLARAAVLCDNFQKMAKFSLWHVARRSELAKLPDDDAIEKAGPSDNKLTCRICLRFDCPYHGEIKEQPDGDSDDGSESVDSVVATDIVRPPKVNYRTRVAIPPPYIANPDTDDTPIVRADKKDAKYWKDFEHESEKRVPFYPCHHPGVSCEDAQCSCFENRVPCEKICSCAPDCKRKFQGCACSTARYKKGNRGPCFEDERCACWQHGRECDPDLCGDCSACEVVDPVNRHNDKILHGRCRNCSIQRGVPKHMLLGESGIHGLGLYACEDIREHDFVGEYKGEIITKEEAERRGAVYEHQKLSYLFSLNAAQEIDSTNFGNKIRFINHAKEKANLYPRIIMVNTVQRIALYARCKVAPGQELLFDYGPKFPDEQLGGKKSKKSAPHVRNAELIRSFLEVEESKDEVGNVRAKGVTQARGRKPRGGARGLATRKPTAGRRGGGEERDVSLNQDAGQRMMSYNISDEVRSDLMELDGEEPAAEEDDEFDGDAFEEEDEDEEYDSGSESGLEDEEDEDEVGGLGRGGRGGAGTRRSGR